MSDELDLAMIGHALMGAAHSQEWRVAPRFFDLQRHRPRRPHLGRVGRRRHGPPGWYPAALEDVRRLELDAPATAFETAFSTTE